MKAVDTNVLVYAEITSSPGDALHCSIRCALDDGTTVAEGTAELVPVARPRG